MLRFSSKTSSFFNKYRHFSFSPKPNSNVFVQSTELRTQFDSNLVCLQANKEDNDKTSYADEFSADVEKIFRILKKFHSRVPKLELALQASGVVLRPGLTERVINRCGDAGNLGYQYFMWASKQPNYFHSYDVYKSLIKSLSKMRQFGAVWALIEEMRRAKPELISGEVFVVLMRRFASARMVKKAIEVLDEMPKYGCEADELGEVKEAVNVWIEMEASGFSPGIDSFVVMIHGFLGQGFLVEACEYSKEMVGRGLLSAPQYGTLKELLNALLRAGKLEMAKDVWSCIVTKGCDLNVSAWTIWIHSLFSNGHVKEACSYCLDMMDADVMPQPDTFAKLMRGLRKLYNRQIAAEITEKVRKMAAEREITFKMYKRRGERDLKEKVKAKEDGRKRRARQRRWGGGRGKAKIL
ncbi:hypothetical protein Pint_27837 [Pistacia integerrima]|uniref:Uncharacterized protein n=1 Tax=Pistacia integerrima TaxID=434235 RepID=A0ACC0YQX8_9ROSI|nr:hypothetical protein Pint_27837 [Pistacia integerrima]